MELLSPFFHLSEYEAEKLVRKRRVQPASVGGEMPVVLFFSSLLNYFFPQECRGTK
jgi:hypothetical protein